MTESNRTIDWAERAKNLREDRRRSLGMCGTPLSAKHASGEDCTCLKTTKALLEAPNDPTLLLDCDGKVLAINAPAAVSLSVSAEQILGQNMFDHLPSEVVAARKALFDQAVCEGKPLRFEDEMGGTHYQNCLYPVLDGEGKVLQVVVFAANITGRKRIEEELQMERNRARKCLQIAGVIFLALDKDGRVVLVNQKGCEVLGCREDEIVGQKWFERFLPEDVRESAREVFDRIVSGDLELQKYNENTVLSVGRGERMIAWHNSVLTDSRGRIIGSISSGEDITDRRKSEDALKASERAYRELVTNIPIVAWTANAHGRTRLISPNVEKVLGYTPDEVRDGADSIWFSQVHSEDYDRVVGSWNALLTMGRPYDVEFRMQHRDGRWVWLHDKALRTQNREGEIHIDGVFSDITERKSAEEALRESEAKYRQLFSTDTEAIVIMDATDFRISDANEAALKLHGYTREEMLELHGPDLSAEVEETRETLERARLGAVDRVSLRYHKKKDGTVFPAEISSRVFALRNSSPICATVRDISDHLAAEDARRQSEEKLESITSAAKDAIVMADNQGKVVYWNPAAERMFGYSQEEALDRCLWDLVFPEDARYEAKSRLLHFGGSGEDKAVGKTTEQQFKRRSDELFPAELSFTAMKVDGQWHSVSLVRDITRRKKAEETLRESEHKYRTLVERASEGILIAQDGLIKYANAGLANILGCTIEEITDQPYQEFVHPDDLPTVRQNYENRMSGRPTAATYSTGLRNRDGQRISVELSAAIIQYQERPADLVSIRDVTEIERLWELESRAKRLETAGQIAGQVAHDFNNLLGPLMAYPGIARDELPENHPVLAYLEEIEKSARQIADINQQLLTLGRRGHYNQKPLNINEVVLDIVRGLDPRPSTLVVDAVLEEDLFNVMGGRSQIHRALSNLISNARDALQDIGRITVSTENFYVDSDSVKYGTVPKGEYVKLTIADNGHGIPREIVQNIFDPFFSTKTADKKRGSGLGLSVVDAVVKDHNGHLDLKSTAGQGTSFYLYFPITREVTPETERVEITGGSEKILVVDDDDGQRKVMAKLLTTLGYQARAAECGEVAVELLKDDPHDLVILDMVMPPGIDGAETYERILNINPAQKALIVSGFAESDRVQAAQRMGAGAYIRKPLTRETIAVAIRRELEGKTSPLP